MRCQERAVSITSFASRGVNAGLRGGGSSEPSHWKMGVLGGVIMRGLCCGPGEFWSVGGDIGNVSDGDSGPGELCGGRGEFGGEHGGVTGNNFTRASRTLDSPSLK